MKKGFTLIELLVAATIIGILAVFATVQYRNTVWEARWNHAKAMTDHLASAVERARFDYPGLKFQLETMANTTSSQCPYDPVDMSSQYHPYSLIQCNYAEKADWQGEYFRYLICLDNPSCKTEGNGALACVFINSDAVSKLPSHYRNYYYCVNDDGTKRGNS